LSYKTFWLLFSTVILVVLAVGCNDTLRQFITPVPQPGGDPGTPSHAIALSSNPMGNGSDTHINVSGDTEVAVVPVGPNPIFLGKAPSRAFTINGDGTVSVYFALSPTAGTNTVTLPTTGPDAAVGPIGGGISSSGNIFIANRGSDSVSVISGGVLAVTSTIHLPGGSQPVMVAGNSGNSTIYVVNTNANNVSVISTIDNKIITTLTVGSQPIWAVMSADARDVFVVNQGSGTVSVIDTLLNLVIATVPVGPSPNFAFYEPKLKRVYVSNTGNSTISVIKANGIDLGVSPQVVPVNLKDVQVSAPPVSVTALSDGTKAYAALANCTDAATNHTNLVSGGTPHLPNCNGNLVSVIDANALVETKTIQVGPGVVSVDSAADGSRVYVVSAHDVTTITDNVNTVPQPARTISTPSISIIRTSTDSVLRPPVDASVTSLVPTIHTPQQDPACTALVDSTFNKKVAIPCAGQMPFSILVSP
jgi:YVTN family beta-propeller protein